MLTRGAVYGARAFAFSTLFPPLPPGVFLAAFAACLPVAFIAGDPASVDFLRWPHVLARLCELQSSLIPAVLLDNRGQVAH